MRVALILLFCVGFAHAEEYINITINGRTYMCGGIPETAERCYYNSGGYNGSSTCNDKTVGSICDANGRRGQCFGSHKEAGSTVCKCLY